MPIAIATTRVIAMTIAIVMTGVFCLINYDNLITRCQLQLQQQE